MIQCKICGSPTEPAGVRKGKYIQSEFELVRCTNCHFSFVVNPYLRQDDIYGQDYYVGKGADPLVDYEFESSHPDATVRNYEWRGIERVVLDCTPVTESTKWLDFGCGTGGLVRHCRDHLKCQVFGYESGYVRKHLGDLGDHLLAFQDLEKHKGTFDVITAIEVMEHVPDPVAELRLIRSLLKPDALFFCTTGNAQPFSDEISHWKYLIPEIHISLFEPLSLEVALQKAGLRAEYAGFRPGFEDIIRFKILKNLRFRRMGWWEQILPWRLLTRVVDLRYKVSAHPRGWAA